MRVKNNFRNEKGSWYARSYSKLLKVSNHIEVQLKQVLKPFDITHSQLNVLNILVKTYPSPIDAKTLKSNLVVHSPDLTRLLDRLEKKGLIERKECSGNRRKIDIKIENKGLKLFNDVHALAKKAVNNYFEDNITEEEAKELFRILNKIEI